MINLEKQLDTTHSIYEIEDNLIYLQNCISKEKQKSNVNLSRLGKLRYELERLVSYTHLTLPTKRIV